MVNVDVVARKLASASGRLSSAESLFQADRTGTSTSPERRDLATFYTFLAIQECIDLAAHWVAERQWDPSNDAGTAFDTLAERGAIDRDLAEHMRDAVGLRNRIAHGYTTIDHDRLMSELDRGAAHLRRFLDAMAREAGI